METALVCNMNALDEAQRARYKAIIKKLDESRLEARELEDGYGFRFKAESQLIKDAAEFIAYERLCCPFFNFELAVQSEDDSLWLKLHGREGIKEFISHEFKLS